MTTKQELIEENEELLEGLIDVRDHLNEDRTERAEQKVAEILDDYDLEGEEADLDE